MTQNRFNRQADTEEEEERERRREGESSERWTKKCGNTAPA